MRPRAVVALAAGALAVAALGVAGFARSAAPEERPSRSHPASSFLAAPPRSALTVPAPSPLRDAREALRWAPLIHPAVARSAPELQASVVARLAVRTPEDTPNSVLVLAGARDRSGTSWLKVRLPILPNGSVGWIARSALGGYRFMHTRLVIDTEHFTATLRRDGRVVFTADVGVGRPASPTPNGAFYIRNRLTSFHSPFYGPLAFGTSARSSVLTDWPAGGFIGIHGTNEPELLPGRVSHGCIRMRNEDIVRLGALMPVGTPVSIV